jgi:uncharacterized protein YegJ (DUF2314 family)
LKFAIALLIIAAYLFYRFYYAHPAFPPLATDPDDPLLKDARDKARESLPQMLDLFRDYPEQTLVKIKFVSNSDQVEYLWGELKEVQDNKATLFLVTPPISHSGKLDRNMVVDFDDLEDWQVTDPEGNIYGGFSQRAMFQIARQKYGKLPRKLARIEALYKT